jgi:hypothetical protein
MPTYFSKFPKITYKFPDGTEHTLTDINVKYSISDLVKSKSEVFYPFNFRDGDRPDILADKYYDSVDYYWLVLTSNEVFDVNHDLPITAEVFDKFLVHKYTEDAVAAGYTDDFNDVLGYCFETIHHYEDSEGYIIDLDSFLTLGNTKSVTIYDYEFQLNESKRAIRFIEASRTSQIQTELEDKLRKLRADLGQ